MDNSAILFVDFSTLLTVVDKTIRQENQQEIEYLNDMIVQPDLTDFERTLHPATGLHILLSGVYGTFSRIDYMLVHKTSLSQLRRI